MTKVDIINKKRCFRKWSFENDRFMNGTEKGDMFITSVVGLERFASRDEIIEYFNRSAALVRLQNSERRGV